MFGKDNSSLKYFKYICSELVDSSLDKPSFDEMAKNLVLQFDALSCSIFVPDDLYGVLLVASTMADGSNLEPQAECLKWIIKRADEAGAKSIETHVVSDYYTELWECVCQELSSGGITYGYLLIETKNSKALMARLKKAESPSSNAITDRDVLMLVCTACKFRVILNRDRTSLAENNQRFSFARKCMADKKFDEPYLLYGVRLMFDTPSLPYMQESMDDLQTYLMAISGSSAYMIQDDTLCFFARVGEESGTLEEGYEKAVSVSGMIYDYVAGNIYGAEVCVACSRVYDSLQSLYCVERGLSLLRTGVLLFINDKRAGLVDTDSFKQMILSNTVFSERKKPWFEESSLSGDNEPSDDNGLSDNSDPSGNNDNENNDEGFEYDDFIGEGNEDSGYFDAASEMGGFSDEDENPDWGDRGGEDDEGSSSGSLTDEENPSGEWSDGSDKNSEETSFGSEAGEDAFLPEEGSDEGDVFSKENENTPSLENGENIDDETGESAFMTDSPDVSDSAKNAPPDSGVSEKPLVSAAMKSGKANEPQKKSRRKKKDPDPNSQFSLADAADAGGNDADYNFMNIPDD